MFGSHLTFRKCSRSRYHIMAIRARSGTTPPPKMRLNHTFGGGGILILDPLANGIFLRKIPIFQNLRVFLAQWLCPHPPLGWVMTALHIILTSRKNRQLESQKKVYRRLFIYGYNHMPLDPNFCPTDHKFGGEFESALRSGFRARNEGLKDYGVSGSEGDNSPFRRAGRKYNFIFRFPIPQTALHTFLGTHGYFLAD